MHKPTLFTCWWVANQNQFSTIIKVHAMQQGSKYSVGFYRCQSVSLVLGLLFSIQKLENMYIVCVDVALPREIILPIVEQVEGLPTCGDVSIAQDF